MDWQAIWLSVRLAGATTAILLALGLPIAYWLTFSPRRPCPAGWISPREAHPDSPWRVHDQSPDSADTPK